MTGLRCIKLTVNEKIAEPGLLAEFEFYLNFIDKFLFLHSEGHIELRQPQLGGCGLSRLSVLWAYRLDFVKLVKSPVPLLV